FLAQRVDLDARLADHDARPRGVDVDRDPLLVLADQDVRQSRVRELPDDVLADLDVLEQRAGEVLRADHPVRLPVVDDADPQAAGVNLLAHYAATSFFLARRRGLASAEPEPFPGSGFSSWSSLIVIWQVRLRIWLTRPRARCCQRFSVGPSS